MTKIQIAKKYRKALDLLQKAEKELREIQKADHREDAGYFATEINELITCDGGEAGLTAYIKNCGY